jgi:putative flavoprotein involved in K+ transport
MERALEEGTAMQPRHETEHHDVIVVGAGQTGLAAGHHLAARGIHHVILEGDNRVGDVWRRRYDSLRLYSPARYDALPGLSFPGDPNGFPTGSEMADYLEGYAQHFGLPVRTGVRVDALRRVGDGEGYAVRAGSRQFTAGHVIVSTGAFQRPFVPDFSAQLDPGIRQLHSADYRRPSQLIDGPALVVGASHSGADLAFELASSRDTHLAGRIHGQLPFALEGRITRLAYPLYASLVTRVLTLDTSIGRKVAPKVRSGGGPLLRVRRQDLAEAGVQWSPARVVGVTDGKPTLADGTVLDVANIVWCTGFRPDYSWIDLTILDDDGWPRQWRGIVDAAPGLYVLGIPFLHGFSSMLVLGAGADAEYVVDHLASSGIRASRGMTMAAAA